MALLGETFSQTKGMLYHGTPVALHLTGNGIIDPARAQGGDVKDPRDADGKIQPNLYLAVDPRKAAIYAAGRVAVEAFDPAFPYAIYHHDSDPKATGYIYQINPAEYSALRALKLADGTSEVRTNDPINIKQPHDIVHGLDDLTNRFGAAAFQFKNRECCQEFFGLSFMRGKFIPDHIPVLQEWVATGKLRHHRPKTGAPHKPNPFDFGG